MEQNYITLNDGNRIPQLGLGVYMIRGDEDTRKACLAALETGDRRHMPIKTSVAWVPPLRKSALRARRSGSQASSGQVNTAGERPWRPLT